MSDPSASTRNLVIGMLFIAAPFAGAYLLTRSNPDAQVLLIIAVFCAALGVTFAFASGVQQVAGLALRLSGRSSRDIAVVGLAALTLLTPWTIDVSVGHLPRIFGWANPLAWLVALGLVLSVMQTARPYHGQALLAAGLGLVAWVGWASWLVTTPAFRNLHFSFMPIDVISTGWYAGVIGFVWALMRRRSGSIVVTSISHGVWNSLTYVLFGYGTALGVLGIHNTIVFGPEVGVFGLALNLAFAAVLWVGYSRARAAVPAAAQA